MINMHFCHLIVLKMSFGWVPNIILRIINNDENEWALLSLLGIYSCFLTMEVV